MTVLVFIIYYVVGLIALIMFTTHIVKVDVKVEDMVMILFFSFFWPFALLVVAAIVYLERKGSSVVFKAKDKK